MWKVINEVLGKTIKKNKKIYLYDENQDKKDAQEVWPEFIESWKKNVYQKDNLDIELLWRGDEGNEGLKRKYQRYIRDRKNKGKDDVMMEVPKITEEEQ